MLSNRYDKNLIKRGLYKFRFYNIYIEFIIFEYLLLLDRKISLFIFKT